ncbi:MAG: hypothetical protein JWM50_1843, partial [Microbacteriaceae bacterium]|nr:hypothetical protein [Microbacteriaceae bacterium]
MSARRMRMLRTGAVALSFVAGCSSVAYAFWSGAGTGSVSERVDDPHALVLTPGPDLSELFPGGTGSVTVRIDNPNPVQVFVPSLQLDPARADAIEVDDAAV